MYLHYFTLSNSYLFFIKNTASSEIYTLSLHDALPICLVRRPAAREFPRTLPHRRGPRVSRRLHRRDTRGPRSEEHTSELESPCNLVCRLLLEKKKNESVGGEITER